MHYINVKALIFFDWLFILSVLLEMKKKTETETEDGAINME